MCPSTGGTNMENSVEKIEVGGLEIAVGDVIVAKGIRLSGAKVGDPIEYKIKVGKIYEPSYGLDLSYGYYVRGKAGVRGVYLNEEKFLGLPTGRISGIKLGAHNALATINEVVKL